LTLAVVGAAFAPDSAHVSPAVRDALAPYIAQLLASDRPVHVDGHTDRRHTSYPGGNQGLSEDRAAAVAQVLTELGVPLDRLIVAGYADRRPLDEADTPEAFATNRRVEINMEC
jgi:chemotaxis protein MotB